MLRQSRCFCGVGQHHPASLASPVNAAHSTPELLSAAMQAIKALRCSADEQALSC